METGKAIILGSSPRRNRRPIRSSVPRNPKIGRPGCLAHQQLLNVCPANLATECPKAKTCDNRISPDALATIEIDNEPPFDLD